MKAQHFPLPPIIEIPAFLQVAANEPEDNSAQTEPSEAEHRYVDSEPLGEGGTANIYKMTDSRLGRDVVVKRFKKDEEANTVSDYKAELSAISLVQHPNVVSVYETATDDFGDYIVMEYIDGVDVEEMVKESPFDLVRFLNFATQCLEGLLAVHSVDLLHLDLKPSNIMVAYDKAGRMQVKLIDFGRTEKALDDNGKPPAGTGMNSSIYYASPEQLLGDELDARSDLYALGCVFYWCLTGKRPFDGGDTLEVIGSHLQNTVTPLAEVARHIPPALADWVMSLLSYDVKNRPSSTRECLAQLLMIGDPHGAVERLIA